MQSLDKRIASLELAHQTVKPLTIIVRIVSPGNLHPDYNHIRANDGQEWMRLPGETEQDFTDRAREVKRNQWGNARIIMDEVTHASH